ncbi:MULTISPECIES: hypothetical protein [Bacillaceae]|uniref:YqgU-like 6-bladed beta-propeller domain-containing protein n=1 Tax=Metabacillus sediminis TaxID=3117746 RepID=A0ABZ2NCT8_9BACI|nr:hypothetical protein [Bacillus sp. SJS]KZZ86311.1 hypothetical protein AS29_001700 [Bacillus sp. SJS]
MRSNRFRVMTAAFALAVVTAGCTSAEQQNIPAAEAKINMEKKQQKQKDSIVSYQANEETFQMVGGWMGNDTVVFAEYKDRQTVLYTYNFTTGQKLQLYSVNMPVTDFETSPSGDYILLQGSPSSKQIVLLLIDAKGEERFEKKFSSHDLAFSWSKSNSDRLFVTSFNEDWTYKTVIYYPLSGFEKSNPIDAPFAEWTGEGNLLFAKDNTNQVSDIYQYDPEKNEEKLAAEKVLAFYAKKNVWVTLSQENGEAFFHIHDGAKTRRFAASIKQTEGLAELPKAEISPNGKEFLTYEYNKETDKLDLVSFSFSKEKKNVRLEDALNVPLQFSPDGTKVLYGFQLEKVFNMVTGSLKTLIKF